ncbi:MAG: hypothetical protein K8F91_02290 [Candidatus Obscuribacterales bacterium]|nr:hypothetical protein [Candidatus Obscuribacterales bacterium]
MRFATRCTAIRYRLGELLLEAGIISPDVLTHGLSISKRAAMPIGRVLIMSGHVSYLDIDCAVQAQTSIREGSIDAKLARELLRFSHVHQVTIDEAYRLNGISRDLGPLSRLGKLLLAAGVVDECGLRCAIKHSQSTGYPIGRALVALELLSESLHIVCMNLQILLKDGRISFLDAVRVLKSMHADNVPLEQALSRIGYDPASDIKRPRIGELLVDAGLLSYEDALVVTELGTENDTNFGKLLLEYNLTSLIVVEAVLQIQQMFSNTPLFTRARAIRLLKLVSTLKVPLEQILSEVDTLDQIVTLLRAAELIDEKALRDAAAQIVDFEQTVAEAVITRGVVSPLESKIGLDCLRKIQSGALSYEEALNILRAQRKDRAPAGAVVATASTAVVAA